MPLHPGFFYRVAIHGFLCHDVGIFFTAGVAGQGYFLQQAFNQRGWPGFLSNFLQQIFKKSFKKIKPTDPPSIRGL